MIHKLKRAVQDRYGANLNKYKIISMASQVVNGTNYWFKIATNKGYIHVKVYKPLKGEPKIEEVVDG